MARRWLGPGPLLLVKERSKSAYQAFFLNRPRWHVDGSALDRCSWLRKEVKVRTRLFSLISPDRTLTARPRDAAPGLRKEVKVRTRLLSLISPMARPMPGP